jgi:Glycoside hydrolase 123, catalytic domain/Glycoside hydrolase 123 N-terminal domain
MKKLVFISLVLLNSAIMAQDMSYSRPGSNLYMELPNPSRTPVEEWSKVIADINVSFASDNVRYPKEKVPAVSSKELTIKAWKGEKVHAQILVWTKKTIHELSCRTGDLSDEKGHKIKGENIKAAFVRYVMTDEFGEGCDERTPSKYSSSLVEDPIDIIDQIDVQANCVQPVWLTIQVPGDCQAGRYNGSVTVHANGKHALKISVEVSDHQLPPPSKWKYDLDLWQSPDPIAKVHDVKLWSEEHFTLMKPYFTMLAGAGQKSITAIIIDQPWGSGHVYYKDPTLIKWTRRKDGKWSYDYTIFDRYVSFMMGCGIDQRINCYSMVTWNLSFIYYDEVRGDTTSISARPGSQEYNDFWEPMLRDFTRHLKIKGWFDKAAIAMDERDMESMKAVFVLLKKIDPGWKTALAGNYHPEIAMDIYDYCIIIHAKFDPDVLKARKEAGKPSTYYTACGENKPNGFTFSPPAENTWISWHAAAEGFTGYLRWAYNNWTKATLQDTRYRTWPGGDCYQIYPGPRTSIRFEKLIEGIQDFEKIRILREQFTREGDEKHLKELNDLLSIFTTQNLETIPAEEMVMKGKSFLNRF